MMSPTIMRGWSTRRGPADHLQCDASGAARAATKPQVDHFLRRGETDRAPRCASTPRRVCTCDRGLAAIRFRSPTSRQISRRRDREADACPARTRPISRCKQPPRIGKELCIRSTSSTSCVHLFQRVESARAGALRARPRRRLCSRHAIPRSPSRTALVERGRLTGRAPGSATRPPIVARPSRRRARMFRHRAHAARACRDGAPRRQALDRRELYDAPRYSPSTRRIVGQSLAHAPFRG